MNKKLDINKIPSRYQEWLQFVFDRPAIPNAWNLGFDVPTPEADDAEICELVAHTLENCGRDLDSYSQDQIGHGLNYIFSNSCSDLVFSLMDDAVPMPLRLRVIASIKDLYRDCITPKCLPELGHIAKQGTNMLNYVCYMLWDISPLSWWENRPNRPIFYGAIVDVLEDALTSPNPACVESALHGLGHIHSSYIERVEEVIAAYLRRNVFVHPQLKIYAEWASTGNVQ
jgi:hypothetical protein